ncbi:unnamed protein product [Spirodela intermedia]|uniref:DYW domain-containing protein n=1 Tax=Spirodela intermedia TaxID=51605 RepID=A0A7I8JLQ6_SPIIN|nr:unnamed protein product [Spirodela intermedia]CAA6670711.1 unnamed protein product [Spirodela intermedia]
MLTSSLAAPPALSEVPSVPSTSAATFSSPAQLRQLHAKLVKSGISFSAADLPRIAVVCGRSPSREDFQYARSIIVSGAGDGRREALVWNSSLNALAESDRPPDVLRLFSLFRAADIPPDKYTFSFVLKACTHIGSAAATMGRAVHGLVEKFGLRSELHLHNTLLLMYGSCGPMADALQLFEKMPTRDAMPSRSVRSWTAMIAGYVHSGDPKTALHLFRKMQAEETSSSSSSSPNEVTFVAAIAACADLGDLDLGRELHHLCRRRGFHSNVRLCNTLIDMYVKCGSLSEARKVFDEMPERTVVSWSAMICGMAMHGRAKEALELFSEMESEVCPNGVTFLGLLHACSHMGMVEEGRRYFAGMWRDYGVRPEMEHYGCMVDLLSRAGRLQEAAEFIAAMPVAPSGAVWGALLGGARLHGDVAAGELAMRELCRLEPSNDGYYIVLCNIYAGAGRWEEARVRRMMKEEGVKKTPGRSRVAVAGMVHEFVAGDCGHPRAAEIQRRWEELSAELRRRGYVPDTSQVMLDVGEEEKERSLARHSEKMALSFGLMSTPPGTTIRIMKNLRVCGDCHAAFKLVSAVSGRKIVVRDRNRFHCFEGGSCSCGDYW